MEPKLHIATIHGHCVTFYSIALIAYLIIEMFCKCFAMTSKKMQYFWDIFLTMIFVISGVYKIFFLTSL